MTKKYERNTTLPVLLLLFRILIPLLAALLVAVAISIFVLFGKIWWMGVLLLGGAALVLWLYFPIRNSIWVRMDAETEDPPKRKGLFLRDPNHIRESVLDTSLSVLNIVLLLAGVVIIVLPLLQYFSLAFNNGAFNLDIVLVPKVFSLKSFEYVLFGKGAADFWRAFGNSVLITLIITIGSNLVEAMAAYPLSKSDCPFRSGIMMYFIITMLFSAGIMPIYLLMNTFHLIDSLWSVVLISISNVTHLLYFKTFFEGIPADIEEAARLDGASEWQLFFRIIIPMSLPIIGSCCFFTIVGTWNGYGSALLFIHDSPSSVSQMPLAYYIYYFMNRSLAEFKNDGWMQQNFENVRAAMMILSIIPILCMYPYVVRYIKGGLQIGSVKG